MTTFYGTFRKPPHDRAIGIEIECFSTQRVGYETFIGFFYVGRDASIDRYGVGWRAYEFVSQPLTPSWLKKEIAKLYKHLPIESNGTCGIHIHVSRSWCSPSRGKRIAKFLQTLSPEDMEYFFGRRPNDYCSNRLSTSDRYVAVNLTNQKTVEFRSFRSGSEQWAKYCVDLVVYLVTNAATLNVEGLDAFRSLYPKEM